MVIVDGVELTVTVRFAVASEHPPVPATEYVIIDVPAATPLTIPEELTVAIEVLADVQVPPETVELNVVDPFEHKVCVPLNVPADGGLVTVKAPETLLVKLPQDFVTMQ